eukprot:9317718-Prorocentrum_lima.AAC.1
MTSSLVGSEMCIRDRLSPAVATLRARRSDRELTRLRATTWAYEPTRLRQPTSLRSSMRAAQRGWIL